MSIEKLKKIIYLSRASGIFLPKKSNKSPQSSAVTSKMSYINFRLRNYEINKTVNKLKSQDCMASYKTVLEWRLA